MSGTVTSTQSSVQSPASTQVQSPTPSQVQSPAPKVRCSRQRQTSGAVTSTQCQVQSLAPSQVQSPAPSQVQSLKPQTNLAQCCSNKVLFLWLPLPLIQCTCLGPIFITDAIFVKKMIDNKTHKI